MAIVAGMAYIVSPHLLKVYNKHTLPLGEFYERYRDINNISLEDRGISPQQFPHDASVIYGIICHICGADKATEIINKHSDDTNGIAALVTLIKRYGGSPSVKILLYEQEIDNTFNFKHKGGLAGYLKDFEQAYVKYCKVENNLAASENRYSLAPHDDVKRDKLYRNLYHEPAMRNAICLAQAQHLSYHDALTFFNEEALKVDHFDHAHAQSRSSKKINFSDTQMEELKAYLTQTLPNELILSSDLYKCIPQEARIDFDKNRQALAQRNPGSNKQGASKQLPHQYPNSQN